MALLKGLGIDLTPLNRALLLSPGYSLAEVSSDPGSKKVTFLPSPGFFTGVLKIKGKELKHTISL